MLPQLARASLRRAKRNGPAACWSALAAQGSRYIGDLLLSWMFEGGQYQSGWAILERAVYCLAVLALLAASTGAISKLKVDIAKGLAAGRLPDQQVRDSAAIEIRGRVATLYRNAHWGSAIDAIDEAVARADHAKLKPLLEELADLISPGTVGQAADHGLL